MSAPFAAILIAMNTFALPAVQENLLPFYEKSPAPALRFDAELEMHLPGFKFHSLLFVNYVVTGQAITLGCAYEEPSWTLSFTAVQNVPQGTVMSNTPAGFRIDGYISNGEKRFTTPHAPRDYTGFTSAGYNPDNLARVWGEAESSRIPLNQVELLLRVPRGGEPCAPLLPAAFSDSVPFQLSACSKDGFLSDFNFHSVNGKLTRKFTYTYTGTGLDARIAELRSWRAPGKVQMKLSDGSKQNGEPVQIKEVPRRTGGRDVLMRYRAFDIGGHPTTLPASIDVRNAETGAYLRSATFRNYAAHTPVEDEFEAMRRQVAPSPEEVRAQELLEKYWCRTPGKSIDEDREEILRLRADLRKMVNARLSTANTGLTLRAYRAFINMHLILSDEAGFDQAFNEWNEYTHRSIPRRVWLHSAGELIALLRRWKYEALAMRTESAFVSYAHQHATPADLLEALHLVSTWQQTRLLPAEYIQDIEDTSAAAALAIHAAIAYYKLSGQDGGNANLDTTWGRSPANFTQGLDPPAADQFRTFRALADDLYGRIATPDPALTTLWEGLAR